MKKSIQTPAKFYFFSSLFRHSADTRLFFISVFFILSAYCQTGVRTEEETKGINLFNNSRFFEAIEILDPLFKKNKQNEAVFSALYRAYFMTEEYQKARTIITNAPAQFLRQDEVRLDLAQIQLRLRCYDECRQVLEKVSDQPRKFSIHLEYSAARQFWPEMHTILTTQRDMLTTEVYQRFLRLLINHYIENYDILKQERAYTKALVVGNLLLELQFEPEVIYNQAALCYQIEDYKTAMQWLSKIESERNSGSDLALRIIKLEGIIATVTGNDAHAVDMFRKAAVLRPDDHEVLLNWAVICYRTAQYSLGLGLIKRALAVRTTPHGLKLAGFILIKQDDFENAAPYLKSCLELTPDDNDVRAELRRIEAYSTYDKANAEFYASNFQKAAEFFRDAKRLFGSESPPLVDLMTARCYLNLYKHTTNYFHLDTAELIALEHEKDTRVQIETFDLLYEIFSAVNSKRSLRKAGNILKKKQRILGRADDRLFLEMGKNLEMQGDVEGALSNYHSAWSIKSNHTALTQVYRIMRNFAVDAMNRDKLDDAEKVLQRIRVYPPINEVLIPLQEQLSRLQNAKKLLALYRVAEYAYAYGNYKEALERYFLVYKSDPWHEDTVYSIANCYFALRDYTLAAAYYRKSYEKTGDIDSALGHLMSLRNARLAHDFFKSAEEYLSRYAHGDPQTIQGIYQTYIEMLYMNKREDDALAMLRQLRSKNPDSMTWPLMLGNYHLLAGRLQEAETEYNYALTKNQYFYINHYNLGMLAWRQGNYLHAAKRFSAADTLYQQREKKQRNIEEKITCYLALSYLRLGDKKKAFSEAVRLDRYLADEGSELLPNHRWAVCEIFSSDPDFFSIQTNRIRLNAHLAALRTQQQDRQISWQAAALTMKLNPEIKTTFTYPLTNIGSAYTISAGGLFVYQTPDNVITAIDEISSEVRWQFTANSPLTTQPVFSTIFYCPLASGNIYALDMQTGKELQRIRQNAAQLSVNKGTIAVLNENTFTTHQSGRILSSVDLPRGIYTNLHCGGKTVLLWGRNKAALFSSAYGSVITNIDLPHLIDAGINGKIFYTVNRDRRQTVVSLYHTESLELYRSFPLISIGSEYVFYSVYDNYFFTVTRNGLVRCNKIDNNGKEFWNRQSIQDIKEICISSGRLYIRNGTGEFASIKISDGSEVWRQKAEVIPHGFSIMLSAAL